MTKTLLEVFLRKLKKFYFICFRLKTVRLHKIYVHATFKCFFCCILGLILLTKGKIVEN